MKELSKNEMKKILGGEWEVIGDDGESSPKCKELSTECSSNDDWGGAKNYCYCRLKGVGCM